MGMNFWQAQEQAKKRTGWMLLAFLVLTLGVAFIADSVIRSLWFEYQYASFPWIGMGFVAMTLLVASFNYTQYQSQGGAYVAETLGAYPVSRNSQNPAERQLLHLVEELAIATGMSMPVIYILNNEQINAFAAGLTPENACVCVTTGAMQRLNRDELQGVLAHEFGHIYNGDMRLSMRLAALLMGFFFIFYIALRTVQFNSFRRSGNGKTNPAALIAVVLFAAGALSWLAGKILSAMISRQREYLADASSAQFTRNPEALVAALKKIEQQENVQPMPASGMAFAHLYFNNGSFFSNLFATHPPLEKRIAALLGKDH